jgi:hypothetical protein
MICKGLGFIWFCFWVEGFPLFFKKTLKNRVFFQPEISHTRICICPIPKRNQPSPEKPDQYFRKTKKPNPKKPKGPDPKEKPQENQSFRKTK